MISESDLAEEFGAVQVVGSGVVHFQDEMRTYTYNYWLHSSEERDLLVVSKDKIDNELALAVIGRAPAALPLDRPFVYSLADDSKKFTHVFVAPNQYHGYLKGAEGIDRSKLLLCVPIYRCEFAGNESLEEFKDMQLHLVPILDWERAKHPKLRVYFDNPATGGGSDEFGVLLKQSVLAQEIENLNGVSAGFIEITNWADKVVEVLSPNLNDFILIRDRTDEELMSKSELLARIDEFANG
jgi:hypothetical protein